LDEQADLLRQVIGALEEMGVPYMIGGSVALAVWAVPRTTHDLDIVVDVPEDRIEEFCAHFQAARYYIDPEGMRNAFRSRDQVSLGMYSFVDMETGFKVDLFPVRTYDKAQQEALRRSVTTEVVRGLPARVYAPDDLLVQKLRWYAASHSERQLRDCLNLVLTDMRRPVPLISWNYVENWTSMLEPGVQQALLDLNSALRQANPQQAKDNSEE
jgi:hypothetical protein